MKTAKPNATAAHELRSDLRRLARRYNLPMPPPGASLTELGRFLRENKSKMAESQQREDLMALERLHE